MTTEPGPSEAEPRTSPPPTGLQDDTDAMFGPEAFEIVVPYHAKSHPSYDWYCDTLITAIDHAIAYHREQGNPTYERRFQIMRDDLIDQMLRELDEQTGE